MVRKGLTASINWCKILAMGVALSIFMWKHICRDLLDGFQRDENSDWLSVRPFVKAITRVKYLDDELFGTPGGLVLHMGGISLLPRLEKPLSKNI